VVPQEIYKWCKFGESITFNSEDITISTKRDRITDRQTNDPTAIYAPDLSEKIKIKSIYQGYSVDKLDMLVVTSLCCIFMILYLINKKTLIRSYKLALYVHVFA